MAGDTDALIKAQEGVSRLVERDLRAAFGKLDMWNAEATRDTMTTAATRIVNRYGEIGATLAADWYDNLRDGIKTRQAWGAQPIVANQDEIIAETVRRVAADLFTDHPETFIDRLIPHAQQSALESVRETVRLNAQYDPAAKGWQRVTNPGACDYCEDLADGGNVWSDEDGADFEAHTGCNCTAAPVF